MLFYFTFNPGHNYLKLLRKHMKRVHVLLLSPSSNNTDEKMEGVRRGG